MEKQQSIQELIRNHRPGRALEQRFYTDPEIYDLERERVLFRHWFMAGHASQIPNPGDYLVARMDRESAIVVRGPGGNIRAFANVCRHRGSLICLQQSGNVRRFECPYHGWMYDLDGRLSAARSMPEGFDKSEYSLAPVALESLGGLLFVSFSDSPLSMALAKRELAGPLAMFGFENLKVAARRDYPIEANWKLAVENYQECYHCATAHPDYAKMHTLMLDQHRRERLQGRMRSRFEACGLRDFLIDYSNRKAPDGECPFSYWRTALFEGYKTGSRDGGPVAPLLGELMDYDGGASDWGIGPLTYMLNYSDHVVAYVVAPLDATHSNCTVYWMVRDDAVEGRDYDLEELTWLWDVTTRSDKAIIVNNWRGVNSRYYRPGPLSSMENWEASYIDWLIGELGDVH